MIDITLLTVLALLTVLLMLCLPSTTGAYTLPEV
jgi:hypothetical protein